MINRMAHLTLVRTYRSTVASGLVIETGFQILNTLLEEKGAQLALPDNQLFRILCWWEGVDFLVLAKEVTEKIGSPTLQREIDRQLARVGVRRCCFLGGRGKEKRQRE